MSSKPVLEEKEIKYKPVSNAELDEALVYATQDRPEVRYKKGKKKGRVKRGVYVGQTLSRDLLRIIGNTTLERRAKEPKAKLAPLAANVAREAIPMYQGTERETQLRYEGYKCAVMKIMNIRRVWQMRRDAERKALGLEIPERPAQTEYPLDKRKKHEGQRRMFS